MISKSNTVDQKTIEENKRKQNLINMRLGTSLKVDGSWGPYQQSLYDKATLKDKEYPTTINGLIDHTVDWFTGNTKYRDDQPDTMRQVGDQQINDPERNIDPTYGFDTTGMTPEEVQSERNKRYFHPTLGNRARWSVSMNNDTNPFVGLGRTFLPAAETAATVTGITSIPAIWKTGKAAVTHPQLVTKVVKGLGNTVKNTHVGETVTNAANKGVRLAKYWKYNPSKMLKGAGKATGKIAADFGAGMIGGEAVNAGSELATGKDWGHLVELGIGMNPELGEWTNPGYLLGGLSRSGINLMTSKAKLKTRVKDLNRNNSAKARRIQDIWEAKERNIQLKERELGKQSSDYFDALQAEERARMEWKIANPYSKKNVSYNRQAQTANNKALLSNELHPDQFAAFSNVSQPELTVNSSSTANVAFTNPKGNTISETFTTYPNSTTYYFNDPTFSFNPKGNPIIPPNTNILISKSSSSFPVYQPNASKVNSEIGKYVSELNRNMGGDGIVAGSAVHHANNIFPGTVSENGLRGPADTEIYTTAARKNSLIQRLGFKQNGTNSTGGAHGTSPLTFRNNDAAHFGIDTEINVIQEDANGRATGKIAHQIYRTLFPDEYSKMAYDHSMKPGNVITEDLPLPMSAEELFQALKNPDNMENHLLNDMLGMNTFRRADKVKGSKRIFQALFNTADGVPEKISKAMNTWGRSNLGSNFKSAVELYPNLNLSNVAANKDFVMRVYGVSEEAANAVAQNPKVMANLINYYNWSYSTGTRLVGSDVVSATTDSGLQLHNPKIEMFSGNGSFTGGNFSGNGLNRALLNPEGGWTLGRNTRGFPLNRVVATQTPLTLRPEKIKSPLDLYNQVERLKQGSGDIRFEADNLITNNINQRKVPFTYDSKRMQEIKELAYLEDTPVNLNMNKYGFGYSGSYTEPIAVGVRTADRPGNSFELGSLLRDLNNRSLQMGNQQAQFNTLSTEIQNGIQNNLNSKFQWPFTEWSKSTPKDRVRLLNKMYLGTGYTVDFPRKANKSKYPDLDHLKQTKDAIQNSFDRAKKLKDEWLSAQRKKGLIGRDVKRIKSEIKDLKLQQARDYYEKIVPLHQNIIDNNAITERITLNPSKLSYKPIYNLAKTQAVVGGTLAGSQPLTQEQ